TVPQEISQFRFYYHDYREWILLDLQPGTPLVIPAKGPRGVRTVGYLVAVPTTISTVYPDAAAWKADVKDGRIPQLTASLPLRTSLGFWETGTDLKRTQVIQEISETREIVLRDEGETGRRISFICWIPVAMLTAALFAFFVLIRYKRPRKSVPST